MKRDNSTQPTFVIVEQKHSKIPVPMKIHMGGDVIEGVRRSQSDNNPNSQLFITQPSISGSVQAAIDASVAGNGDQVLVVRGGHSVTAQVDFNKSGLTVIAVDDGLSPLARGEFNAIYAAASYTDGPAAQITAPTKLVGMGFASRDTGALFFAGAALLIGGEATANPFGVWLKHCRFPKWGLDNRIGIAVEGSSDCLIEKCSFEGVGSALRAGIYLQGAMQNITIRKNIFRQCTAAVLLGAFAGGGPHMVLGPDNVVEDGFLLETDANTATGSIIGNYVDLAVGDAYDRTVTQLKAQGLNPSGNHYLEAN